MGSDRKRDVGREFERDLLVRATHRLSRHLTDHLSGEFAAIDDVAAVLRTLCAKGRGDKLIQRVCHAWSVEVPLVWVSDVVAPVPGTILEIGGLPNLRQNDPSETSMTFLAWLNTNASVVVRNIDRPWPADNHRLTWAGLINDLANLQGSHATQVMPDWIETTTISGVHNLSLADYLIETIGVIVEDILRRILESLGLPEHGPRVRLIPVRPTGVSWLRIESEPDGSKKGAHLSVHAHAYTAGVERVGPGRHPVVRVTLRGVTFGMDVILHPDGSARYLRTDET